jgi:hypothetical protein
MSLVYAKKSDEIGMCFMCASRVGMVQANVGQKRLKRNILRRFFFRSSLANFHLSA